MTFKVPESKRSIAQNRFEFELPDGTELSIPKAKFLTIGQVEMLSDKKDELSLTDMLSLFKGDPAVEQAVRAFDSDQLMALMTAWQEDSGISTGESTAS